MILTDRLAYYQLQKTGCSHIEKLLLDYFQGTRIIPKHGRHDAIDIHPRLAFGSIRNPLDWYVSFWAFSCADTGGISARTAAPPSPESIFEKKSLRLKLMPVTPDDAALATHAAFESRRDPAFWKRLHKSSEDVGAFREWIVAIHANEHRYTAFDDFGHSGWFGQIGLFSYLSHFLFLKDPNILFSAPEPDQQPVALINTPFRVSAFVRTEALVDDLILVAKRANYALDKALISQLRASPKTNTSEREPNFLKYHSDETIGLIANLDGDLARLHGYSIARL